MVFYNVLVMVHVVPRMIKVVFAIIPRFLSYCSASHCATICFAIGLPWVILPHSHGIAHIRYAIVLLQPSFETVGARSRIIHTVLRWKMGWSPRYRKGLPCL